MTTELAHGGPADGNRGVMLVLCYLPPFAVVPLLTSKEDAEIQWHARHGIVLMVAEVLVLLGILVVALVVGLLTAGIGCGLLALTPIPMLAFVVLHIVALVRAFAGRRLVVPWVSQYADRF